jgi:putative transposase
MNNEPQYHNRQSTRLKGYDYSQAGAYFITICVNNREYMFGKIEDGKMIMNKIGETSKKYLTEIPQHFPNACIGEYVVMPNHVHLILVLNDVRTCHGMSLQDASENIVGTRHGVSTQTQPNSNQFGKPISGSVSVIINHFKSSVKRWCNKNGHLYFTWQPRFHDHIIRNEISRQNIADYIVSNPAKWKEDMFYKE